MAFEGVCLPLELGGLGLKRLREVNLSLLCKWFWQLKEERVWVNLLKEKYGTEVGGYLIKCSKLPIGVSFWRGLAKIEELFKCITMFEVGNGETVGFWRDGWVLKIPLADLCPHLFPISATKNFYHRR